MAQTARVCSFLDRPWTLEDILSIPSDSDTGTSSDDELMEHVIPRFNLVHGQHPNNSLSSDSAIVASMANVVGVPMEDVESPTHEVCVAEAVGNSDPSASNSSTGVFFASSAPESPWSTAESDMSVYPAIQHHDNVTSHASPTPSQGPCVISAASQRSSAQPAPILPSYDRVLYQQYAGSSCQARLSSVNNLTQFLRPHDCSTVPQNWYHQSHIASDDHSRIDGVALQSDDELHLTVHPALARTVPSACYPISLREDSTEAGLQRQAADNSLPPVPYLGPSRNSLQQVGRQTSTNAQHKMNQIDGACDSLAKQSYRRPGYRKAYNLRPLPAKRQPIEKENRDKGEEVGTAHHKRRKVLFSQSRKHSSQQRESELLRSRKPHVSRKRTKKDSDIVSGVDKRPVHPGVGSYKEWSLANAVLKCNNENGSAMFQLHFTSAALWKALTCPNGPAPKDHQLPNKVKNLRHRTKKKQLNQHTQKEAPIQAGYPSICPDIYRMSTLLARWRRHTFLVKWSDATTTWEPRKHIIDKRMLSEFEANWQGFDAGVDILDSRFRAGKRQCLLHWHGRPPKEDTWVDDKLLSPNLLGV